MRVLGIDAPQGWAVLQIDGGKPVYVDAGELDAADPPVALATILSVYNPDLVAIERVETVVPRDGFGPNMAGNLYRSGWTGGELRDRARTMGFNVVLVEAPEVRAAFGIRAPKGKADAMAAQVLRARCPSWPAPAKPGQRSSTVHERDAALAGLFAVMREQRLSLFASAAGAGVSSVQDLLSAAAPAGKKPKKSGRVTRWRPGCSG